ncbi:dynein assembly factor 1, axonemal homolog [Triticum dicoccoides]|uniref:dynein assembly factor 1, axonemal homolog n=1 Tax=Triticum dicoccoides TaxID=85692 RepID=UPI000E78CB7A|nr:dynein assembly factor 1, axonemal homolog [Triticum dicoccoides]
MGRLTLEQTAREAAPAGCLATFLDLSHRSFTDVSCLGSFKNLERLDLGHNCLLTLEGLSACTNLKWLSVIENKLVSLKGAEVLSKLQVLNAGKNKLTRIDEVKSMTSLGALILNDNNITSICKLDPHHQLNTLVLSKNPVITFGDALVNAKSIKKISMSHCEIESIGSSLAACVELKELRLAHNKITTIPSDLAKNTKILNLDLGNNLIERESDLKVLSELRYLRNLNLQGNPIAEKGTLAKKVMKIVPNLRIFNAKPIEAISQNENSGKGSKLKKDEEMPDRDPIDSNMKKEKRKRSKQQVQSPEEPAAKDIPPAATIDAPVKSALSDSKKKKKEKVVTEQDKSSKTKIKDDKASFDDTELKAKKESKKKKSANKEDKDAGGIDDTEVSFAELMFSGDGAVPEPTAKDKAQATAVDGKFVGGLVIDHSKKRKKAKGTPIDASDLKQLCSAPEVGAGGLSGWD